MIEIMNGTNKKCPNSKENLLTIGEEFGKNADAVHKILTNLEVFSSEDRKHVIDIFKDLLAVDADPNPLAKGMSEGAENTIKVIFDKFELTGMSTSFGNVLKMMSNRHELVGSFLNVKLFQILTNFVMNAMFDISSEAISVFEEILFSDNVKVKEVVSEFLNDNHQEMMEIFMNLFDEEKYLAKREGMKILHELLLDKDYNKKFTENWLQEKEYLKFTMTSLTDDSTPIQMEAFHLMLVFLKASPEKRGQKVNETLKKNKDQLMSFFEEFLKDKPDEQEKAINLLKEL
jgi:hypothetical protein